MISVIVPIYNEEARLSRCVDWILRSGYPDFELLLVDDGSTDRSPELCRACCQRDSRIRWIRQERQGVSAARNRGIVASRGEWIVFVDADDLVSPDFLGLVAREAREGRSLLLFDFAPPRRRPGDELFPDAGTPCPPAEVLGGAILPLVQSLLTLRPLFPGSRAHLRSPCAKAYWSDLLRGVRFSPGIPIGEDALFNTACLARAESIAYIPRPVYFAEKRLDSATHRFQPDYLRDDRRFQREMEGLLEELGLFPAAEDAFYENVLASMAAVLIRGIFHPDSPRTCRENRRLCREMLSDRLYRQALAYNGRTGVLPRRLLLFFLRTRCFSLVKLISRASYRYLYLWKGI